MYKVNIKGEYIYLSILDSYKDWSKVVFHETDEVYHIFRTDPQSPYMSDYITSDNLTVISLDQLIINEIQNNSYKDLRSSLMFRNEFFTEELIDYHMSKLIDSGEIDKYYVDDVEGFMKFTSHYPIKPNHKHYNKITSKYDKLFELLSQKDDVYIVNPKCVRHNITFDIDYKYKQFTFFEYIFENTLCTK